MVSFIVTAMWTPDVTVFLGVYKDLLTEFKMRPILGYLDLMDESKWAMSPKSWLSLCFFFCKYDKKMNSFVSVALVPT
jgi:hypothetical protein